LKYGKTWSKEPKKKTTQEQGNTFNESPGDQGEMNNICKHKQKNIMTKKKQRKEMVKRGKYLNGFL